MTFECLKAGIRWRVSWLFVGLAGLVGTFSGAHFLSPVINGPTVYLRDSVVLNPTLVAGEPLRLKIVSSVRNNSQCTGYVTREFWQWVRVDGQFLREKYRLTIGAPPIPLEGEREYVVLIPTPVGMSPGSWQFRGRTTLDCGALFGGIFYYDTPPLDFTVVK